MKKSECSCEATSLSSFRMLNSLWAGSIKMTFRYKGSTHEIHIRTGTPHIIISPLVSSAYSEHPEFGFQEEYKMPLETNSHRNPNINLRKTACIQRCYDLVYTYEVICYFSRDIVVRTKHAPKAILLKTFIDTHLFPLSLVQNYGIQYVWNTFKCLMFSDWCVICTNLQM